MKLSLSAEATVSKLPYHRAGQGRPSPMVGICWLAVGGIRELERNDYAMGGFLEILRHYSFRNARYRHF